MQGILNKRKTNWKLAPFSFHVTFCLQAQIQDRCKTISTTCQEGLLAAITELKLDATATFVKESLGTAQQKKHIPRQKNLTR